MRANRVLGDEESLRDLVGAEVLVEEQQHLDLARRQDSRDLLGDTAQPSAVPHALEQAPGDASGERSVTPCDTVQECCDLLG